MELKHGRIAMLTTRPQIHAGNHELYHTDFTAEAVSGRLATMEIIGVFFQDGLTGSIRSDRAHTTKPFFGHISMLATMGYITPEAS